MIFRIVGAYTWFGGVAYIGQACELWFDLLDKYGRDGWFCEDKMHRNVGGICYGIGATTPIRNRRQTNHPGQCESINGPGLGTPQQRRTWSLPEKVVFALTVRKQRPTDYRPGPAVHRAPAAATPQAHVLRIGARATTHSSNHQCVCPGLGHVVVLQGALSSLRCSLTSFRWRRRDGRKSMRF